MSQVDEQWSFLQDVGRLIQWAALNGFKLTGGELFRTVEQQAIYLKEGKTKTANSYHLRRLAIDLHAFKDGKLLD